MIKQAGALLLAKDRFYARVSNASDASHMQDMLASSCFFVI